MRTFRSHSIKKLVTCLSLWLLFQTLGTAQRSTTFDSKSIDIEKWIKTAFGRNKIPPFSFAFGFTSSASFITTWNHSMKQLPSPESHCIKYLVTYTHPKSKFRVECDITGYTDFQAVDWVLRFVNDTDGPTPQISNVRSVDAELSCRTQGDFYLHYANGSNASRSDFAPHSKHFQTGDSIYMRPAEGRSSSGPGFPFFNIELPGSQGVLAAIGWTGTWFSSIKRNTPNSISLKAGIERLNTYLNPHETIRTASVCLLFWQGKNRMTGHNRFRRFLLAHHSRKINGQPVFYPMSAGFNWGDPEPCNEYSCLTTEYAIALMQRIKLFHLSPEAFWLDAGWYRQSADYFDNRNWYNTAGNWLVDSVRFEHGLKPISDYAHKMGAKFMVWFEPERACKGTYWEQLHPEWMLKTDNENFLFNLANPKAVDWLCKYIGDFLEQNGIDYYRQDFNIAPESIWKTHDKPGREGITEIKYITGLYTFWDYLLKRFPTLLIDNCASGGRRLDYETVLRSAPLWRTDYQYSESVGYQCHTYGLEFYLPQHGTGAYFTNHFDFRSSLSSAVVFNWKLTQQGQSFTDMQKRMAEFQEIRPYFYEDFYPLSGTGDLTKDDIWMAYQLHNPSDMSGYIIAFRRQNCPDKDYNVHLSGLQPETTYILTDKDSGKSFKASGKELGEKLILSADKPRSSVLIHYKASISE